MEDRAKQLLAKRAELERAKAKQEALIEVHTTQLKESLAELKSHGFSSLAEAKKRLGEMEVEVREQIEKIEGQL